ncbi:hypothetical protein [Agrobacterium rosae]|uniref:Uncharacterized protein n=1 Tax=Agrobacterium rosae TaxID=1972867 RepID=A0A1R3U0V6_9HYPH|nr:hypothetical protein [Agrobacterium rosae]SCX34503.1 hypothetical protein DSM25559_4495 [Agrobacterium rosae]
MDRTTAIADIQSIFASYRAAQPGDLTLLQGLTDGKLYELFVLSDIVSKLYARGFDIGFVGISLKFKASPGMVKLTDPHFEVKNRSTGCVLFRIFVDIEFQTLGRSLGGLADNSQYHEIDIVVTTATAGYPRHDEIALGIECKCVANFKKSILKEALGVRRELSYYAGGLRDSILTQAGGTSVKVSAEPASEFILVYIDPAGSNYKESPGRFSIDLVHLEP